MSQASVNASLFSDHWYRVADIKPRLRGHIRLQRHNYRGERWYVIEDPISGQYHRFAPVAYHLIQQMDGKRSLQELWENCLDHFGDTGPTQTETIQLLGQLHNQDLLASDILPNTVEQFLRGERLRRMKVLQKVISPLAIRVPLFDPDRFLTRFQHIAKPLLSGFGLIMWLIVVLYAAVIASLNFSALTDNIIDTVLTPSNLLLIWLLFPIIKALHELGHGFAAKVWGGEVHEMGIMFLVFMPVPYVDASSASMLSSRYKRAFVGAAGMIVELFIAAIALILWSKVEQGSVKIIAYNIVLIAGVSTLFFNANPLLRFDGYYILADLLEIPNLASKASRYLSQLTQRYLFGVKNLPELPLTQGERGWLIFYGIASFLYRMVLMVVITLFVASKFFFIGVLLAIWTMILMFFNPLSKAVNFLLRSPNLAQQRVRALSVSALLAVAAYLILFHFQAPNSRISQGVVWLPDDAYLRSQEACKLTKLYRSSGDQVQPGDIIAECESVDLPHQLQITEARLQEMNTRYMQQLQEDRTQAQITQEMIDTLLAQRAHIRNRIEALKLVSGIEGELSIPKERDLIGQYLQKGDIIAYVLQDETPTLRAVVEQSDIDLIRNELQTVEMRLPHQANTVYQLQLEREVPAGSTQLPSAALGNQGGGPIAVDPRIEGGMQSFQPLFHFELTFKGLDSTSTRQETGDLTDINWFGQRAYIKFHLQPEPYAQQWYRSLRQLFMAQFGV